MPALRTIVALSVLSAFSQAGSAEQPPLAQALIFHASFDQGVDADFSAGDKRLYTAESYKMLEAARPGLHHEGITRVEGKGRFGGALEFRVPNKKAIFFRADKNLAYRDTDWSGTVSFWLNLDPDQDLAPGYCDPIQITDKQYSDAAFWVDFSKDERPRHFRLGVFGDLAGWNPQNQPPDKNPDFQQRLVTVRQPPFRRGQWTHVALVFAGLNRSQPGYARLYLNGHVQGTSGDIAERFTWNPVQATIRLGMSYTGLFDELSVFQRALSAAEIAPL
ncbi:MAG: LamG-like jellyroll fold domain-containing protein, partial [Pirellulaceae bacterium]